MEFGKASASRNNVTFAGTDEFASVTARVLGGSSQVNRLYARRIMACVNACEGVPTEQLEWDNSMFLDMVKERNTLEHQRDELQARWDYYQKFCRSHGAESITQLVVQRDELLTTSKALLEHMQKIESGIDVPDEIFCPWEEAISKAEGGE